MADRIQLTIPYTYMNLDGQPQIVLSGSIVDVPNALAWPNATLITKNVGTQVPANYHAVTGGPVKVR